MFISVGRLRELVSGICIDIKYIPFQKKRAKVTLIGTERRVESVLGWQNVTSD
jgi:hypothetical protein